VRLAAAAIALALAAGASAQGFPARSGETGILDVPDAESSGPGGGQMAAELRLDHRAGAPDDVGALPLYAVGGFSERLDLGFSVRESGQPGDPRPARVLFGAAAKLRLWAPEGALPGAALSAVFDRVNGRAIAGGRLALSTPRGAGLRVAAFAGAEAEVSGFGNGGYTAGLAASLALPRGVDLALEAVTGPRGENFGAALRYQVSPTIGVAVGGNYFPQEDGFRIALTFAAAPPPRRHAPPAAAPTAPVEEIAVAGAPRFLDDRPKFRLRIPMSSAPQLGVARLMQYGPFVASTGAAAAPVRPVEAAGAKAAAPTLEDLADAQVRDQEALAGARDKRVRGAGEQLDAREAAARAEASRLDGRERALVEREQQIEAREKRTVVRTPSQPMRQLESLVAQIAAEERNLAAQEKSFVPALDAATGRERTAAGREQEDGAEAARLLSSVRSDLPRAAQIDLRKQALAARNRQLAAMETRLLARGERLDASERQLRTRSSRVDAWARRLDARVERLDVMDKLLEPGRVTPAPAPKPAEGKESGAAVPPKDKPAFVMVVKAPAATMRERAAGAATGAASGGSTPGVAVEKAVIAATVVMFPTPATQLSELDRETLDNIAKLAAKSQGELLIWARAKDPGLVAEAERRAAEIRAKAITAGPLDASRVTTRVTMRPGATGVDVVVSALRETAKPRSEEAETGGAPRLEQGESGKRQLRDAVQAAQPSIETCVGAHLQQKRMERAEGTLKVTVSPRGRVVRITTGADFAGDEIEACLGAASASWQFPAAEGEYVVDVPITVMSGGASR
jgi:hypothetical protein